MFHRATQQPSLKDIDTMPMADVVKCLAKEMEAWSRLSATIKLACAGSKTSEQHQEDTVSHTTVAAAA